MKKYISKISTYFFAGALLFGAVSCEDLDEGTEGVTTSDTFYNDPLGIEAGLNGIYASLNTAAGWMRINAFYTGADDITSHNQGNKAPLLYADQFVPSSGNLYSYDLWNQYNQTIWDANNFYFKVLKVETGDGIADVTLSQKNNALANAIFVRAVSYLRMTRIFGDMPYRNVEEFIEQPQPISTTEIVKACIADLEEVLIILESIPEGDRYENYDKANTTNVKAYLAKAHLMLTGWPHYYPGVTDKVDVDAHWAAVRKYALEVIESGKYSLTADYAANTEYKTQGSVNTEIIFAHIYTNVRDAYYAIEVWSRYYGEWWRQWKDLFPENEFAENFPAGWRKHYSIGENPPAVGGASMEMYGHTGIDKFAFGSDQFNPYFQSTWGTSNDNVAMRYAEIYLIYAEALLEAGDDAGAREYLNKVRRRAYAQGLTLNYKFHPFQQDGQNPTEKKGVYEIQKVFEEGDAERDIPALEAGYIEMPTPEVDATSTDYSFLKRAIIDEKSYEFMGELSGVYWSDLIRLGWVDEVNANRKANADALGELPIIGNPSDQANWLTKYPDDETLNNIYMDNNTKKVYSYSGADLVSRHADRDVYPYEVEVTE